MPLISSYKLATRSGKERWLAPQVDHAEKTVSFVVSTTEPETAAIKDRGGSRFRCLVCGELTATEYARDEARAGRMGQQLLAVVADVGRSRTYVDATETDEALAESAVPEDVPSGVINEQALGIRVAAYGLTEWADLFTRRQLVTLTTLTGLVAEARDRVLADSGDPDYSDAVATYLALGASKLSDYNSSLVVWSSGRDQAVHVFGRQALGMVWDFAEVNPFGDAAGDLTTTLAGIAKTLERLPASGNSVVEQLDATTTVRPLHDALVATDPPYYDNIGYADLADYFYVWLRRALKDIYPDLFSTLLTPKREELVATPFRHGGRREAETFFEEGLFGTFARMRDAQHPDFPLILFYAFKQAETASDGAVTSTGWETMLSALLDAGFAITGTWPVRTEKPGRMREFESAALASSIVLVCRPRPDDAPLATRREFMGALRGELPDSLRTLQQGNVAPVDLAQAAIGPGMAVYSRYARVVESDGSPLTVRTALGLINQALDEILAEQESDFDADTRFAITWFEQYGMDEANFGQADVLARAKNTSVSGMVEATVLAQRGSKVRLLRRDELPSDWDPAQDSRFTSWEAAQHLVRRLETEGEAAAADLLRRLGGGFGERAKELAYRLFTICDRQGWVPDAVAYNALVVAWPDIARQVVGTPEAEGQQALEI